MAGIEYPIAIKKLIEALSLFPGVGARSAERMAMWCLQGDKKLQSAQIANSLQQALGEVSVCGGCGFYVDGESPCVICEGPRSVSPLLCVVEEANDILPLERSGAFEGGYFVLGGKISPIQGVHPEDLRLGPLKTKLEGGEVEEVILALSSDVEGESTAHFLGDWLKAFPVKVTRLAQGLPAGGGLGHADELTLHRALSGRREWN